MNDIPQPTLARDPHENEFIQAVGDVTTSVRPVLDKTPEYRHHNIVERIVEPERVITFRVPWNGPGQGQPGVSGGDEQRHRPLQRRTAVSPVGKPEHFKIFGLRTCL